MKNLIFLFFGLLILSSCGNDASLDSFSWLSGKWVGVYDSVPVFEQWKPAEGNIMYGRGGALQGKDTTFAENLQLEKRSDGIYYVAIVKGNAGPVDFKFTGFK